MNKLYLDTCAGSLGIAIVTKDKTCKSEINAGKKTAEELFLYCNLFVVMLSLA